MNIGQYLVKARKRQGLSQEDVANSLNVSRQSVSLWECDQTIPTLDNLLSLSELYNVSMDILTGQKEFEDDFSAVNKDAEEAWTIEYEKSKDKKYKVFLIIASVFTGLSALTIMIPILSTFMIIPAIVFSILSIVNRRRNANLLILIFAICLFVAHIFVYINYELLLDLVYGIIGEER